MRCSNCACSITNVASCSSSLASTCPCSTSVPSFASIKATTPEYALYGFAAFYAVCIVINWWFYLRKNAYVQNP